jgi:hypothetical protein
MRQPSLLDWGDLGTSPASTKRPTIAAAVMIAQCSQPGKSLHSFICDQRTLAPMLAAKGPAMIVRTTFASSATLNTALMATADERHRSE